MHDMLEKIIQFKVDGISLKKVKKGGRLLEFQGDAHRPNSLSEIRLPKSDSNSKFSSKTNFNALEIQKSSASTNRGFFNIFDKKTTVIIGELKFASPSVGVIGLSEELLSRAKAYEDAGIDAISVITEEHFFHGKPEFVSKVKKIVGIPVLQKDFVIDVGQIDEAVSLGSDALLLIARIVSREELQKFVEYCLERGIEPVVEITSEEDLHKALQTKTRIIAVNARDLDTFFVDVAKACELLKKIPDTYIRLGFSGIQTSKEVEQYRNVGAKGVLVGTSLMKAKNVSRFMSSLREAKRRSNPIEIAALPIVARNDERVKVKICGIRSLEAAQAAIDAGADFLGFNFVRSSKRYIKPEIAKKIIHESRIMNQESRQIRFVGVFQNQSVDRVNAISDLIGLDYVQLHGEEDDTYIMQMKKPVIKSISSEISYFVRNDKVEYFLIDRQVQGQGEMVNVEKAKEMSEKFKVFLAGGLTPDNVAAIVKEVRPFAVDVAGGIETDGKEDLEKIKKFVKNAKNVILSEAKNPPILKEEDPSAMPQDDKRRKIL